MTSEELEDYIEGGACMCAAYSENECACNADWTSKEVYELRAEVAELNGILEGLRK